MNRDEFEQLSVEYGLGSLGGEDRGRFEAYLRTASPGELTELKEILETVSLLPLVLDRNTPPRRAKENVLRRVRLSAGAQSAVEERLRTPATLRAGKGKVLIWAGIVAVAVIAIGVSVLALKLLDTVDYQHRQLIATNKMVVDLNKQLTELKDELTQKEEMLKILSSRKISITFMNGLQVNPVGYGKIIWDPEKRTAILQVSRLPAVPANRDYQLWVIKGKTPISAGVFAVSDTSASFFKIDSLAVADPREISAFAVTLEPKGGVPAPTGEMYLSGSPKL